jgi:hypothetical protein
MNAQPRYAFLDLFSGPFFFFFAGAVFLGEVSFECISEVCPTLDNAEEILERSARQNCLFWIVFLFFFLVFAFCFLTAILKPSYVELSSEAPPH